MENTNQDIEGKVYKELNGLNSNKFWDRSEKLIELGNSKNPKYINLIANYLNDNIFVAFHAIEALGKIGDVKAIPVLESYIKENEAKRGSSDFLIMYARENIIKIKELNGHYILTPEFLKRMVRAFSNVILKVKGVNLEGARVPKNKK